MAKENPFLSAGVETQKDAPPKKPRFRDTWQGFVVFVVALLGLRFLVFEPFKIPTGSMEPTLIGHEDYGDRIVTNKVAYSGGTNPLSFLGGEPKRFEVFVFIHDSAWQVEKSEYVKITNSLKRNYIKRCVGLPGESIVISGGDLFLLKEGKETVLRKWESSKEMQESVWQPVSVAELNRPVEPAGATPAEKLICKQKQNRAFPWNVDGGKVEFLDGEAAVRLSGPLALTYCHAVTNVYAKVGRWPFIHEDCPAASLPGIDTESGIRLRNPNRKSDRIVPYMANFWSGVECPNCGQVLFPLIREVPLAGTFASGPGVEADAPKIVPNLDWKDIDRSSFISNEPDTNAATGFFFYGGNQIVGDVKLEVELEVEQAGGALELEAGSNLHRASWSVSLGGMVPALESDEKRHEVKAKTTLAAGGKHVLTLAYVDGSVLSWLDNVANDPVPVDVRPADNAEVESLVRLRLYGDAHVKITRLNLYRDLFYTLTDDHNKDPVKDHWNDWENRHYDAKKCRYQLDIPADKFMAMGDNSPSSVDSRFWGFVPRQNLVGRASFVFWPPSRWRVIR
jgi:signal peptidase I